MIGKAAVGAGHFGVADPRHDGPSKFSNVYRVIDWNKHASAVTSSRDVAIADPRHQEAMFHNAYKLVSWVAHPRLSPGSTRPVTARCALPIRGATYIARRAMTGPGQALWRRAMGGTRRRSQQRRRL